MVSRFLSFFALYFGLCFANPLLVLLANREDIAFSPLWFSLVSLLLVLTASAVSYFLSAKTRFAKVFATATLACAFVFAVQGNIVHDLFDYGGFNGQSTDWRQYGWKFWAEWFGFLLAFPLSYCLLSRLRQIPLLLALIPILSSVLLITPVLLTQQDNTASALSVDDVSPDVFEFSSELNLIHLLPDGFQGDIARQVLEDQPELAARLQGFTLYRDHLGMYPGTAPSVPTLFMGRPFDFMAGYSIKRTRKELELYAYPARLHENGFRLDYVPLSAGYCVKSASTCNARSFNDLKARGYFRHKDEHFSYALRQLLDLTLFRQVPMFLKEQLYNDGDWFFADTTLDGSSPWPDPVMREWIDNMVVNGPQPRYKWYHYVGTHIPPHWDADCVFNKDLPKQRQAYYDQSVCVLTGIANLAEKLHDIGILDQTAIIISGDHGVNILPDDIQGLKPNASMYDGNLGAARPALMVKPLNNREEFRISDSPTSLLDIAPTALDLVGLEGNYSGQSVLTIDPRLNRTRVFKRYTRTEFWVGEAISHDTWHVDGAVQDMDSWSFQDIFYNGVAPVSYPAMNYNTASETSRGLSLSRAKADDDSAWVGGSEFAILVSSTQPDLPATIKLTLKLPHFMTTDTQTFNVSVNKQVLAESYTLDNRKDWIEMEIPVPDGLLITGNNLIMLKFSETATPQYNLNWHAAARLKSFNLVQ